MNPWIAYTPLCTASKLVAAAALCMSLRSPPVRGADGELDATFGIGGIVQDTGTAGSRISGLTVQADQKIVTCGYVKSDGNAESFVVSRFEQDGAVDMNFGTAGRVTPFSGDGWAQSVSVQGNGKIVVGGSVNQTPSFTRSVALIRLNSDGTPDATFGVNGRRVVSYGGSEACLDLALQPDGKIVLAGNSDRLNGEVMVSVSRFTTDGNLDTGFGSNGVVLTPVGGVGSGASIRITPDGKIVVGGWRHPIGAHLDMDFVVIR